MAEVELGDPSGDAHCPLQRSQQQSMEAQQHGDSTAHSADVVALVQQEAVSEEYQVAWVPKIPSLGTQAT